MGPGPTFDLLSLVLSLAGVNPNAPANMMSLGIISSLFALKDAWIAVANKDTMEEWSKRYIKFGISADGLLFNLNDSKERALGITNPITGKIILAPLLLNGKKTNYGLGSVIIHEGKHLLNWQQGLLQGSSGITPELNEVSSYLYEASWSGTIDSGIQSYLYDINKYLYNIQNLTK